MKISYEACKRAVSIIELFITALLKTYKKFTYSLLFDHEELDTENNLFDEPEVSF